jgi:hypothetical protein
MRRVAAVVLLLVAGPAWALDVKGPTQAPRDRLVRLEAVDVAADAVVTWDVWPRSADIAACADDRRVEFVAPPGRYEVQAREWLVKDGKLQPPKTVYFTVTVLGTGPPTPPPDPDVPTPPTPQPDGALGLIKASRDGMAKVPAASRAKAAALANAQRSIKSALAAGAYAAQAQQGAEALAAAVLRDVRAAGNAAVAGADWSAWTANCAPVLNALYVAGRLKTVKDWENALEEIAIGLTGS